MHVIVSSLYYVQIVHVVLCHVCMLQPFLDFTKIFIVFHISSRDFFIYFVISNWIIMNNNCNDINKHVQNFVIFFPSFGQGVSLFIFSKCYGQWNSSLMLGPTPMGSRSLERIKNYVSPFIISTNIRGFPK